MKNLLLSLIAINLATSSVSHATFSLAGSDSSLKHTGGALASCTAGINDPDINTKVAHFAISNNTVKGLVMRQSFYLQFQTAGDPRLTIAEDLLNQGMSAESVIDILNYSNSSAAPDQSNPLFNLNAFFWIPQAGIMLNAYERLQYGIVDSAGGASGDTGSSNEFVVGTPRGRANLVSFRRNFSFAIQGNTLTQRGDVDFVVPITPISHVPLLKHAEKGTHSQKRNCASPLMGRLMAGLLKAKVKVGGVIQGDNRCVKGTGLLNIGAPGSDVKNTGISSNQAFIWVKNQAGQDIVNLKYKCDVANVAKCPDAVDELYKQYLAFVDNGCK